MVMQKTKEKIANRGKLLPLILILLIITLGMNAVRLLHPRLTAQETRIGKPVPYTCILRETVYSPDGRARVAMDETIAIRSDGSYVKILTHKSQTGGGLVDKSSTREVFFAKGSEVHINDFNMTKSSMASRVNLAGYQRDPRTKCINTFTGFPPSTPETIIGEEIVGGYRTVKTTSNHNQFSWWYALDYGCAIVKVRADWEDQGYSEKNLLSLIPGEPASTLFEEPPNDREMFPSERILGRGKDPSSCGTPRCAEIFRKLDEEYRARRVQR